MKKRYQIFMLCVMAIALAGCDNYKKDVLKACDEGDFAKAYEILADEDDNSLKREVANKEGMYLLSLNNDESTARFLYLLKEFDFSNDDKKSFLELAISQENMEAANALVPDFVVKGMNDDTKRLVIKYCLKYKVSEPLLKMKEFFLDAKDLDLEKDELEGYFSSSRHSGKGSDVKVPILPVLMEMNTTECNDAVKGIIREKTALPFAHTDWKLYDDCSTVLDYDYNHFSTFCNNLLAIAINKKNKELAEFIVSMAKPLYNIKFKSDGNTHRWIPDSSNIKEMKAQLNNAIASGTFD